MFDGEPCKRVRALVAFGLASVSSTIELEFFRHRASFAANGACVYNTALFWQ
jgi:hypothetical protein